MNTRDILVYKTMEFISEIYIFLCLVLLMMLMALIFEEMENPSAGITHTKDCSKGCVQRRTAVQQ